VRMGFMGFGLKFGTKIKKESKGNFFCLHLWPHGSIHFQS
jgi:hypothetical protein